MKRLSACLLAFLFLIPVFVHAEAPIPMVLTDVRFSGNDVTRRSVLLQELTIKPGDPIDFKAIQDSRRALMNLGLFKSVRARLDAEEDGYAVVFDLDEKYFTLPEPRLSSYPDGGYSYGIKLNLANLGGLNQKLEVLYQREKSSELSQGEETDIAIRYAYPRVVGTPYRFDTFLGLSRMALDAERDGAAIGSYDLEDFDAGFRVSRWLNRTGPSQGWQLGGGLTYERRRYELLSGEPDAYLGGQSVALNLQAEFAHVEEHRFFQEGRRFGYLIDGGLRDLGSDYSFTRHFLYYRAYMPVPFRRYANFNWQARLGLANGRSFGENTYSAGGSKTLRGYSDPDLAGNAMLLFNFQYLHPLPNHPQIRGVWFADVGNVYHEIDDIDPTDMLIGTGFGLRWRLQSFVDVTLSVDMAWGLEGNTREVYAGTRSTF